MGITVSVFHTGQEHGNNTSDNAPAKPPRGMHMTAKNMRPPRMRRMTRSLLLHQSALQFTLSGPGAALHLYSRASAECSRA